MTSLAEIRQRIEKDETIPLEAKALVNVVIDEIEGEMKDKIDETIVNCDELDKQFPKGESKERGKALVLLAKLNIELEQKLLGVDTNSQEGKREVEQ